MGRRQGMCRDHLQPLGVLVEHRIDDVDERLVAGEEAVPAGQQIAFQPALALVLAEHLHHAAVGGDVVVVGRRSRPIEQPVGDLEHGRPAVRGGLVGAEDAEVLRPRRSARITSRMNWPCTRVASARTAPGCGTSTA